MPVLSNRLRTLLSSVVSIDETGAFEDLDSLRIIDIVEIVEAEFGLRISADQVTPETFANVNVLAEWIAKLKGNAP
jgi:acyl carrier protein